MARLRKSKTLIMMEIILRPFLFAVSKRDYRRVEKLPKTGGYVIAPNHNSHLDPLLFARYLIDVGLIPRYLGKESLFRHWFMKHLVIPTEQIPVLRYSDAAKNALEPAEEAVRAGKQVTIYPEGTITRDPGAWPMTGRTGAVRVALATGCDIIPVCQSGAQNILWPYTLKFRILPPRKRYTTLVGDPVDLSKYRGKPITEELLHAATNDVMDTLTEMMIEIRGERPTTPRIDVHTVKKETHLGEAN